MTASKEQTPSTNPDDKPDVSRTETPKATPAAFTHMNSTTKALVTVLTVVVVVAGIVFVYPYVVRMFGKQQEVILNVDQLIKQDQDLKLQIKALEDALRSFEDIHLKSLASRADLKILEEKISRLEAIPQSTEKSMGRLQKIDEQTMATIQNLMERVEKLELERVSLIGQIKRLPAVLSAFRELKQALRKATPFPDQFGSIAQFLAVDDPAVESKLTILNKAAQNGVPTIIMLRKEFASITRELVITPSLKPDGWWNRVTSYLKGSVVIRKIDEPVAEIENVRDLVTAIEIKLEEENLAEALDLSMQYPDQELESFKAWQQGVQQRLDITRIVAELERVALGGMLDSLGKDSGR